MKVNCTLTPQEFIVEGKPFKLTASFDDRDVSIISRVVKKDNIYTLVIKGEYKRGGKCKISLSDPDVVMELEEMQELAVRSMQVVIPEFIFKDYPESLKNVAEDEAKAAADAVEETSE